MKKGNKWSYLVAFFGILNVFWVLFWIVNLYTEIIFQHAHNPIISMFSPYLIFGFLLEPSSYNISFWLGNDQLVRPAIIFWLTVCIGGYCISKKR